MKKLLIVDGSNLLFQMFFGMPARITGKDGRAIQGTLGFVGALLKTIRQVAPTHVCVLFDGECQNERKELDPNYKANREDYSNKPDEEVPFSQLPDIYSAIDFLGIAHAETYDCEVDDWIASYALSRAEDTEIVISSFDSDFFQLISDGVSVLRYRGENTVIYTPRHIEDKFGIPPSKYADFKSLVGDSADNIRGADRIGPKTAAELLLAFGTLDGIIENAASIKRPSIRAAVIESAERLRKNQRLIRLEGKASVPFELEKAGYTYTGITTGEVMKGIGLM